MGIFDSVYVDCPHCGKPVEFQSKADDEPYMRRFALDDAPACILYDIMNQPEHCMACDRWLALVDPALPPNSLPPKPNLRVAKVNTPGNPPTHEQGMKWWPDEKPFSYDDLADASEVSDDR